MNFLLLLASLLAVGVVPAEEFVLQLDPAQTRVEFTLGDVLHTVHGSFKLKSGSVRFDPATGRASGELVIDAASGDSGSGARDGRMKKNILEVSKYPEITLTPDRFEGSLNMQGESQVKLHGAFGIHGAQHEIIDAHEGAHTTAATRCRYGFPGAVSEVGNEEPEHAVPARERYGADPYPRRG